MKKTPASSSRITSQVDAQSQAALSGSLSPLSVQCKTETQLPHMFSLQSLLEQQPLEQNWIVSGLLPTGVSLLAGPLQADKALLANQLGLSVASGRPFLEQFAVNQGQVLYLALAEDVQQIRGRATRLLARQLQLATFTVALQWSPFRENGLADLEDTIVRMEHLRLIIIDPLEYVFPLYSSIQGGNRQRQSYQPTQEPGFFTPLRQLAAYYEVAILLLHHLPEDWPASRRDPLAGLSATGLTPATSCNLLLTPNTERPQQATNYTLHVAGPQVEERRIGLRFDVERGYRQ